MMDLTQLRAQINAVLTPLGLWSPAAEELLCATCAQESKLGSYRWQIGGPALGIFQMEPATYYDLWANYLRYHKDLAVRVCAMGKDGMDHQPGPDELVHNDPLAITMARLQYLRAPGGLPAADDLKGLWQYYKAHYNTPSGAATIEQFYRNYKTLVHGGAQ
jgi:hypothetical protein